MKRMQAKRIAKIALSALILTLAAVLLAVPAYAEGSETENAAPFWFTPIGMTAIILAVAVLVVALVYLVRAKRAQRKDEKPTVIPLEPNLPEMRTQENEPSTFAEAVDRYAKEEEQKAAAEQKRELNRAINEVLYDIRLADLKEKRAQAEKAADVHPEAAPSVPETTEKTVTVSCEEAAPVVPEDDVARELADRVEQRTDRKTDADSIRETDERSVKKAAYYTAFEEAKNISADASEAIDLTEEEDITPEVTAELEEELTQTEQPLETEKVDDAVIDAVIADIRDSVLSEGEEPIELTEEDTEATEAAVNEALEEAIAEEPAEEPAAAAYADLTAEEPEEAEEDDEDENSEEEDSEEDDESAEGTEAEEAPAMVGGQRIVYIDAKANPEAYAELLEREKRGEVTLVYRYRKSFLAKMALAQDTVKGYYSELKNALLAYKGVKCRTSWGYEAFNKGRTKLARMDVKTKSLYLYLAIDPQTLVDTKYNFKDMSAKKKYAATPVLMKIRGERKFKHALELIEKICGEELQLKRLEVEPTDYRLPMMTQDEMIEAGYVKMMVGAIPVVPEVAEPAEEAAEPAEAVAVSAEAEAEATEPVAEVTTEATETTETPEADATPAAETVETEKTE
ncbi:MAG TPA: hypothetical protein DDW30_03625 [Clostridiales bacterium]|nr:hypothetical protein [Clostridiales bacterium]